MSRRSADTTIKFRKLLVIIAVWVCIGILMTCYDHFSYQSENVESTGRFYGFGKNLFFNVLVAFTGAIMGGIFLVYYVNVKYRSWPYGKVIFAVAGSFVLVVTLITLLSGFFMALLRTGHFITDLAAQKVFRHFISDPIHLKNMIGWAPIVGGTQFALQINDKFGPGIIWKFLRGHYANPKEEQRIFLFADLMSSTSIAEKLGNEQYHHLLKDFFADLTNPILFNKGEIYQYVGDEIVISWKLKIGLEDNHCLRCYFEMQEAIEKKREQYLRRYGLVPEFKAGVHSGSVIAGEVGIIKRDITFSGDVLNTAARIQSKCNEYQVKILSSNSLLDQLTLDNNYIRLPLGDIELRGKGQRVALSTIQRYQQ